MKPLAGRTFGIVGALEAFPYRIARREIERLGGRLRRSSGRGITTVVYGRKLLRRASLDGVVTSFRALVAERRRPISEAGFLRRNGLSPDADQGSHPRSVMIEKSGLPAETFDLLALFDAFERDVEPFTFRDLILARKYRGLSEAGADWDAIARAVHKVPQVGALAALTLDVEAREIIERRDGWTCELSGQGLLDLGYDGVNIDDLFESAEAAETSGDLEAAVGLYGRCLAVDPTDSVASFNRANCLRELGRSVEAAQDYARAAKHDPGFVEAWFNLAALMLDEGHPDSARRHLRRALALDRSYADAAFNLGKLEFDAGDLSEARLWWSRYLELDRHSEWAQRARNGLRLIAMQAEAETG
ncbi:tetratricopeptide repeat protein [Silicimonas algicola]|uniref:Tetratricopeptide repeat protein n=1 Tax=Silicimonas algicola TaxID=1826607 RepID=A0A316GBP0_9RHOB|nr:tetratricopeptide repeat protein [Silicimonas algicola]AZQ67939.1 tetratricopeptide repeat protein [Silicimonas algicola]PWK57625.1 tetratricopeptide repeat protein [Silicimonas algicola]